MSKLVPVILVMNDSYWLPYALESVRGWFKRYVIYDVGSKDNTGNIIDWFVETEKKRPIPPAFYVRHLPFVDPTIQGVFRNSMIAEAQSDYYFILDGDEVYNPLDMKILQEENFHSLYGVFKRYEIGSDLQTRYEGIRNHHRVYHRTAIWKGTHPGEEAVIPQKAGVEQQIPVVCHHFHNAIRSPLEQEVPGRVRRKTKPTYQPGKLIPYNLLEELPLLRKPIHTFPVAPELERLQKEL